MIVTEQCFLVLIVSRSWHWPDNVSRLFTVSRSWDSPDNISRSWQTQDFFVNAIQYELRGLQFWWVPLLMHSSFRPVAALVRFVGELIYPRTCQRFLVGTQRTWIWMCRTPVGPGDSRDVLDGLGRYFDGSILPMHYSTGSPFWLSEHFSVKCEATHSKVPLILFASATSSLTAPTSSP